MKDLFIEDKDGCSNKKLMDTEGELTSRMWEFTDYKMKHGVSHPDYIGMQNMFKQQQNETNN